MEINQEWIAQQRAVCNAATPGEWEKNKKSVTVKGSVKTSASGERILPTGYNGAICNCIGAGYGDVKHSQQNIQAENNSAFIAAARTALPAALDALEAAYAEIARLTAERDAESEQIQEIGRFALEQQEATALCELFDALWTVRAMCGSTIQRTENEGAPTGAGSEGVE